MKSEIVNWSQRKNTRHIEPNLVSVKVFVSPSEQPDDVVDELSRYGYIEGYTFNEASHELIADFTDIRDAWHLMAGAGPKPQPSRLLSSLGSKAE